MKEEGLIPQPFSVSHPNLPSVFHPTCCLLPCPSPYVLFFLLGDDFPGRRLRVGEVKGTGLPLKTPGL